MSDVLARVLPIIAASVVIVVLLLVIALAVARGNSLTSPQVETLLGLVGVLGAILASLYQGWVLQSGQTRLQATQADIQTKINGHLQAHVDAARADAASSSTPAPSGEESTSGRPMGAA